MLFSSTSFNRAASFLCSEDAKENPSFDSISRNGCVEGLYIPLTDDDGIVGEIDCFAISSTHYLVALYNIEGECLHATHVNKISGDVGVLDINNVNTGYICRQLAASFRRNGKASPRIITTLDEQEDICSSNDVLTRHYSPAIAKAIAIESMYIDNENPARDVTLGKVSYDYESDDGDDIVSHIISTTCKYVYTH